MTDLDQRGATGPAIYRGMDRPTLDAAYNNSAAVADSPEWLARWRERSAIVRASPGARVDIIYGARSRARLDYFPCGKKQAPLFVFIHGGYWQRNEKETFAFVADGPRAHLRSPLPGNEFSRAEKKASPEPPISDLRDQAVVQEARQFGAFATTYRKSPVAHDCVVGPGGLEPPTRPL
jgi:hypothetical protein